MPAEAGPATNLPVALVGVGVVALNHHLPALRQLGVPVRYAVDTNPTALARIKRLVPDIETMTDIDALPDDACCAIVCSPTAFHAEHCARLVARGAHVLCEKPIACHAVDAEDLAKAATAAAVVLQVGYYRRFHEASAFVRQLLRTREWGPVLRCSVFAGHRFTSGSTPVTVVDPLLSGGGAMIDFGVHVVDRLLSWFDDVVLDSYADDAAGGIEANALARLTGTVDGAAVPITIAVSRTHDIGYRMVLTFDDAAVVCDLNRGHEVTVVTRRKLAGRLVELQGVVPLADSRPPNAYFADQWREFAARVAGAPERLSSLSDARRTTALVETAYQRRERLCLPWECPADAGAP